MKEKEERQTGKQIANKVKRSTSRYGDINICMYKKILISQQCITTSGKCAFGWCSNAARISSKLSSRFYIVQVLICQRLAILRCCVNCTTEFQRSRPGISASPMAWKKGCNPKHFTKIHQAKSSNHQPACSICSET